MALYSEEWGEAEKPGTILDTQNFIRDDHPDCEYIHTLYYKTN